MSKGSVADFEKDFTKAKLHQFCPKLEVTISFFHNLEVGIRFIY